MRHEAVYLLTGACMAIVAVWACRSRSDAPLDIGSGLNSVAYADVTKLDQDYETICGTINGSRFIDGPKDNPTHPAAVCVAGTVSLASSIDIHWCCAKKKFEKNR